MTEGTSWVPCEFRIVFWNPKILARQKVLNLMEGGVSALTMIIPPEAWIPAMTESSLLPAVACQVLKNFLLSSFSGWNGDDFYLDLPRAGHAISQPQSQDKLVYITEENVTIGPPSSEG